MVRVTTHYQNAGGPKTSFPSARAALVCAPMRQLPLALATALAALGCDGAGPPKPVGSAPPSASSPSSAAPGAPTGSGSAAAPVETYGVPFGLAGDPAKVIAAVNSKHAAPHAG